MTTTGIHQSALDAVAQWGLANGEFEDSDDEAMQVAEEFFSPYEAQANSPQTVPNTGKSRSSLKQKLAHKAQLADGFALSGEVTDVEPQNLPE